MNFETVNFRGFFTCMMALVNGDLLMEPVASIAIFAGLWFEFQCTRRIFSRSTFHSNVFGFLFVRVQHRILWPCDCFWAHSFLTQQMRLRHCSHSTPCVFLSNLFHPRFSLALFLPFQLFHPTSDVVDSSRPFRFQHILTRLVPAGPFLFSALRPRPLVSAQNPRFRDSDDSLRCASLLDWEGCHWHLYAGKVACPGESLSAHWSALLPIFWFLLRWKQMMFPRTTPIVNTEIHQEEIPSTFLMSSEVEHGWPQTI